MAKNKKAQILAAVMCATTVVGFSPVITHAATLYTTPENVAVDEDSTGLSVTLQDGSKIAFRNDTAGTPGFNVWANQTINGDLTIVGPNHDFTIKEGTLTVGDDAFKVWNDGGVSMAHHQFAVDTNGNLTITKDEGSGQTTKTNVKAGYVGITNKYGNETFAVDSNGAIKAANGNFNLDTNGNLNTKNINGEDIFANSVTADSYIGVNGSTTDGNVTTNTEAIINNAGEIRLSKDVTTTNDDSSVTTKNSTANISADQFSIQKDDDYWIENADGTYTKQTGTTKTDIKAGYIGITNKYGDETFAVDSNGAIKAANGAFKVAADGALTTNGITVNNENGFASVIIGNDGSILAGKNGNFQVTSEGVLSVGNNKFTVDQYGGVKANKIISAEMYVGTQTAENKVVTAGQLGTSINKATEGTVKWDQNDAGEYQEGTLKGIHLNDGNLEASNIITETFNAAGEKFRVNEDGSFTAYVQNGGMVGITDEDAMLGFKGNSIVMNNTGTTISSNKLTITNGTSETVIDGKYINGVYMRTEGNDVWANDINISALGSNSQGITNGNFQVAENGSVTNTIKNTDGNTVSTITTNENGLTVEDQNGSTVVNGSGVTTTGDGNFGGDVNVGGFLDVDKGAHIGGDLIVDGTINGKDFNDLATNTDISNINNKVSEVNSKVDAVDAKVGDTSKLNSEVAVNGANTSLVDAINAETTMRQQLSGRVDGLEGRVGSLEERMGDVEDRIDKVGAMSAAIANLRTMGYDPEAPTEIAVGVGQYKSETGLALGVFHYPNEDFMLSASISTSGDEVMGGIGATWKLGRKSTSERAVNKEKSRELKAEEKAAEMKQAAQKSKVDAQRERHAKMLAEREAANK